jgi:hypothetical protein
MDPFKLVSSAKAVASALRGVYTTPPIEAATLTPPPLPKAPKGAQVVPGYRKQAAPSATAILKTVNNTVTLDRLLELRNQTSDYGTIRAITKYSPEIGSSTSLMIRTVTAPRFTLTGRNLDGQVDRAATEMAHEILRRVTFLGAADGSFGAQRSLQSLSETLLMECVHTGAMGLEVALDKARVPSNLNPVPINSLVAYDEDNSFKFKQKVGGQEIDLDIANFIYVAMDQVTTEAYPTSPLTSAIQAVATDIDFNSDMRKALKRAVLPRLNSEINSELFRKNTPPEVLADPEEYVKYQNLAIQTIQDVINGLNPEDALVSFDFVKHSYVEGGHDPSQVIERVQKVLNAKLVAGSRALPVTLGFSGTSGASSAESLLFLKHCNGYRQKLNEIYSRAFTVAIRIMGIDGYVEAEYGEPNLKPADELEAFDTMKQSRILQLLSLGFISDDEASIRLTGSLPSAGFKPLSGTRFMDKVDEPNPNGASNTANASERNLKPSTPTKPKS